MGLPLPVSSPAAPQGASALPPRTGLKVQTSGAHGTSKGARGKGGFASVLAAVQQDDTDAATATAPSAGRTGAAARVAASEPEADHRSPSSGQAGDVIAVAEDDGRTVAVAQTPWLLFALGSRSHTWQDGERSRAVADGVSDDGTDPADWVAWESGSDVTGLATTGLALDGELPALEKGPQVGPGQSVDPDSVVSTVTSGDPAAGAPTTMVSTAPTRASEVPTETGSATVADDPRPGGHLARAATTAADPARLPAASPAPESFAESSGLTTGTKVVPTVGSDIDADPVRAEAASSSIEPVAHSGRSFAASAPLAAQNPALPAGDDAPSIVGAAGEEAATTAVSPSRTHEVLLRLAQAGDGPASHGSSTTPVVAPVTADVQSPAASMSASTVAAAAHTLPPAVAEQVLDRVVGSLRMQWKDGIGEAKVRLHPEGYGQVNVALKVEAGAVTAIVRADSADVQEWVVRNQETLRQQLEAAGLRLDELVVTPDDQRQRARQNPQEQQRRRPQPTSATEAGLRFEQLL